MTANGRVTGVRANGVAASGRRRDLDGADAVRQRLVPDLPEDWKRRYAAIPNIGVVCVVFKLKRSVTPHFWVNITDESIEIPGIIEFSNLRPTGDTVVYVPYYMPVTNPKWAWTDERSRRGLRAIRRSIRSSPRAIASASMSAG